MTPEKVKAQIDAHVANLTKLRKMVNDIPPLPKGFDPKQLSPEDQATFAENEKQIAMAQKAVKLLEAKTSDLHKQFVVVAKSLLTEVTKGLAQSIKDYQVAIKKSDGLTAQRPKVVSALQNAAKARTPTAVVAARTELDKQIKEVQAEAKKSKDAAGKKKLAAFEKEISKVTKALSQM